MRTEYKRGKPLDLQVPAARMKTMQLHTFLKLHFPTQMQTTVTQK